MAIADGDGTLRSALLRRQLPRQHHYLLPSLQGGAGGESVGGGESPSSSLHTARHPQARTNRRKDGDEGLNYDFPNIFLFHGLIYDLLFMIYDFQLQVTSNFSDADCADNADLLLSYPSICCCKQKTIIRVICVICV